jgi:lysozyme
MIPTQKLEEVLKLLLPVIKLAESCKLKAYKCPAGVWTCGWGATGAGIGPDTVWTQEVADHTLRITAIEVIHQLLDTNPALADATPARIAALADFIYNLGIGNYKSSTLKTRVNEGDWAGAAIEIMRWDKCKGKSLAGLTKRRAVEAAMLT